ncbi:MAG: hypothetical protein A2Y14_01695 [Verrucomicrobia bacterium GWF2_51_19]|nr:MAG: hypothetical protein A2Y14_01695 [Verrucomicrobia bacterium GWF2_51_19]HCJ12010.1 hypothetical protein [Opitutae bacterium]
MKILSANEQVLLKRFPDVLKQIVDCQQGFQMEIDLNRWVFSADLGKGQKYYPYGIQDGRTLIRRWIDGIDVKHFSINATTGFGLGFHLEGILKKLDSESLLMVGERFPEMLGGVLSVLDCSQLLADPRLILTTGPVNDDLYRGFYAASVAFKKHLSTFVFSPLQALDESYYNAFFMDFGKQFRRHYQLQRTNIEDSPYWQNLTLANLPYLLNAPDVIEMRGLFAGFPVVLVSAGPSLDESIEFLKAVQDKAVIVAVNSAYRKLSHEGIRPHLTLAADPRRSTFWGYGQEPVDDVFLLSTYFVNTNVVKLFPNRTFTWSNRLELINWVKDKQGKSHGTPITEQGTVSACIADLAKIWGCNKICLVGQDLAYSSQGQTHTGDSFYADEGNLYQSLNDCMKVPGNTFGKVPSTPPLYAYLKAFEEIARINPDIDFINTSRLGAKVNGVPYKTFAEAAYWFQKPLPDLRACLRPFFQKNFDPEVNVEALRTYFEPLYHFAQQTFDLATQGAFFIQGLSSKCAHLNYAKHPDIQKVMEYATRLNALIDKHPHEWIILCEGKTKAELFQYKSNIALLETSNPHWEAVLKNKEYFWAILEGAHFLLLEMELLFSDAKYGASDALTRERR